MALQRTLSLQSSPMAERVASRMLRLESKTDASEGVPRLHADARQPSRSLGRCLSAGASSQANNSSKTHVNSTRLDDIGALHMETVERSQPSQMASSLFRSFSAGSIRQADKTGTSHTYNDATCSKDLGTSQASQHPFLVSRFQVGINKGTLCQLDYPRKEKVAMGDVYGMETRVEAHGRRKEVIHSKSANTLGLCPVEWNQSTIADQKIQKDPTDVKRSRLLARLGVSEELQLKPSKNHSDEAIADLNRHIVAITGKGPVGKLSCRWFNATDERGLSKHVREQWPDWNNSTATHSKDDLKQAQAVYDERESRMRMSAEQSKLNKEAYIDPATAVGKLNDRIRKRKIDFQALRDRLKVAIKDEFPEASDERIQAIAQRLLNEKLQADYKMSHYPVHDERFRPNISLTSQDRRYKDYFHPGAWTWIEAEGCYAWSCCSNNREVSKGCEFKVVNPDQWKTHGFERRPGLAATGKCAKCY